MTTLSYTDANGITRSLLSTYIFILAGGPNAGDVWIRDPVPYAGSYRMTPASAEEITEAQASVTGFSAALTSCQAITDGVD